MKRRITYILASITLFILAIPLSAHADLIGDPGKVSSQGTDRPTQLATQADLGATINFIWGKISGYIGLLGIVAALYLIWNGIRYATSQGDAKKTGEAKQAIVQLVIAIALITAAFLVVTIIWAGANLLASNI